LCVIKNKKYIRISSIKVGLTEARVIWSLEGRKQFRNGEAKTPQKKKAGVKVKCNFLTQTHICRGIPDEGNFLGFVGALRGNCVWTGTRLPLLCN
jgi:hypothetical protein